jgi:hypothetical protein
LSISAGSISYIPAGSVRVTNEVSIVGSVVVTSPISVSVGSESWIKNFNELGSSVVVTNLYAGSNAYVTGSVYITGSVNVVNPISVGSETYVKGGSIQTFNPIGVGSVLLINGSIMTYGQSVTVGSEVYVKNFGELGSNVVVTNFPSLYAVSGVVNIGTMPAIQTGSIVYQGTSPWVIAGSITSMPSVSVSTGSEVYVKGGSIAVYNLVAGSIVSMPSISVAAGSQVWVFQTNPTSQENFNYGKTIVYSGTAIGSVYKTHSTGSWVQVFVYSGTALVNINKWVQV